MRLRLAATVLLALSFSARGSERLRVIAPADGAVLRGGSVATIAWAASGPLPEGAEEWEAFLSVDGGRYYATRITPHLNIDIREFEWRVPNVSSPDVRLLIRMGDEREERSFDVPLRLSIVADPLALSPLPHVAAHAGESARPGDPGVATWVEGDRKGHELVLERAPICTTVIPTVLATKTMKRRLAVTPGVATSHPSRFTTSAIASTQRPHNTAPGLARDLLLLGRRRNV